MGYLRRTLQVRIPIDMAMDSHTPATEYGYWEERLVRDECTYNLFFSNPNIYKKYNSRTTTNLPRATIVFLRVAVTLKK